MAAVRFPRSLTLKVSRETWWCLKKKVGPWEVFFTWWILKPVSGGEYEGERERLMMPPIDGGKSSPKR